jgi:hypothetical protein
MKLIHEIECSEPKQTKKQSMSSEATMSPKSPITHASYEGVQFEVREYDGDQLYSSCSPVSPLSPQSEEQNQVIHTITHDMRSQSCLETEESCPTWRQRRHTCSPVLPHIPRNQHVQAGDRASHKVRKSCSRRKDR